ncbi:hypothetical protein B5X24_HaOG209362 [Helicoverpa armigera]|nr:hypothetical protein B5X24_HaOG209362 [Helicoverpa armigera]
MFIFQTEVAWSRQAEHAGSGIARDAVVIIPSPRPARTAHALTRPLAALIGSARISPSRTPVAPIPSVYGLQ